jgi:hypothetical protein
MKMDNQQSENVYSTMDVYQAGFQMLRQHIPVLDNQRGKVVFVFKATDTFYNDLNDYNSGATVEALKFAIAIKTLKSQIFSIRNKGEWGKKQHWTDNLKA